MTPRNRVVRVRACAKLNVTLRVLGARPDGYHELRTTFQTIALHDTLTATQTAGPFRLECNDPRCPVDDTNLVWRAAQLLWRARGKRGAVAGVTIRLVKRIPIGSGLGGGSSDAAAVLRGLEALWRSRLDGSELRRLARELGADVPFFLEGGTALGIDRGDVLFPLVHLPQYAAVVAIPPFGVSTRDAYAWWDSSGAARARRQICGAVPGLPDEELVNDLQGPVSLRHPQIGRLARRLRQLGASFSAMSGSGSAVFGLFESRSRAERAARQISTPPTRVVVTRTVPRAEYGVMARPKVY
jgi:4-diphosphocytidyl-2-C-methyl-D-erythritol kinase